MKAWDENQDFQKLVKSDADINENLTTQEIAKVFSLETYLRNIEAIFDRVFTN